VYVIIDWHEENADSHQQAAIAFFTEMAQNWGSYPTSSTSRSTSHLAGLVHVLKPYHQAVVNAIRAVDPDNLIVLGTPSWSQEWRWPQLTRFRQQSAVHAALLFLHSYPIAARQRQCCAVARAALFVTEWGATDSDGGTPANPELCLDEAQLWHNWMNSNGLAGPPGNSIAAST